MLWRARHDLGHRWAPVGPTYGTEGPDVIVGRGPDEIYAYGGDDLICSGTGQDVIDAGPGDDRVSSGHDHDYIDGGEGVDRLWGNQIGDTILGGSGHDRIWGGRSDDYLTGGLGDAFISGGLGRESFWADPGDDILHSKGGSGLLHYGPNSDFWMPFGDPPPGPVVVDLPAGTASGPFIGSDELRGTFKGVFGSREPDTITGAHRNEQLLGNSGDDVIEAGGGDDTLSGEDGDDTLKGNEGEHDRVDYTDAPGAVIVDLPAGTATGWGTDNLSGIEDVYGRTNRDNTITGDGGPNHIRMGEHVDVIKAGGGADKVSISIIGWYDPQGLFDVGDSIDGGGGADTLWADRATRAMEIDLGAETANEPGGVVVPLLDFENVDARYETFGDQASSIFIGDDGPNVFLTNESDDVLEGRGGDDVLEAGNGDDVLKGGDGVDHLDGGPDQDECINGETVLNCEMP